MEFPGKDIIYDLCPKLCVSGVRDATITIANINVVIIKISCSEF
jgi:hypothetical protein